VVNSGRDLRVSTPVKCRLKGLFIVQNQSPVAVPSSVLAIYLSSGTTVDPATDTLLKRYQIGRLKPGQIKKWSVSVNLPAGIRASGKYVIAIVDADGNLPDIDGSNNIVPYAPCHSGSSDLPRVSRGVLFNIPLSTSGSMSV